MQPQIQYVSAQDGVSIAYWTLGQGTPLLALPPSFSHIQLEWQFPEVRSWYERLARTKKLVRYDWRGFGLSEREVADRSFEAHLQDIETLADRLSLRRFALFGLTFSGPVAIGYAARHPERVSHLILWGTWANPADYFRSPIIQSVVALRSHDWEVYSEAAARVMCGWSEDEPARRFASLIRESISQEPLPLAMMAVGQADVMELLPNVERGLW